MENKLNFIEINKYIDSTILKPDATENEIIGLTNDAIKYNFYAICVNPSYVKLANNFLKDSKVKLACVVGFPLGENKTFIKLKECELAIAEGADEIDVVMCISKFKNNDYDYVYNELKDLQKLIYPRPLKVIFETCLLTNEEIIKACKIATDAGAKCVKTSSGFSKFGATVQAVSLMRENIGKGMFVKASGGIKTLNIALEMINAGAERIGTSSGISIYNEYLSLINAK